MNIGRLLAPHKYGGQGTLQGDIAISLASGESPVDWRVYLYVERSPLPGNIWPPSLLMVDSLEPLANGHWEAKKLDVRFTYTAIGYDPSGEYAPAIQAGLQAA
jgi:hypothetical protein